MIPTRRQWIILGSVCILLLGIGILIGQQFHSSTLADQNTSSLTPESQVTLNKTFSFPVTDTQGQQVATISYTVLTVDKQNQVIVKGQKANAINGRTFLVITLKLTNASTQSIQLNSKDYIRISVGKSSELLAADLYNDPILIQPISTQYTRLGFAIDASENHVVLHVGELNGDKTAIPVNFR